MSYLYPKKQFGKLLMGGHDEIRNPLISQSITMDLEKRRINMSQKDVEEIRKFMHLPTSGPIDFVKTFGMSYPEILKYFKQPPHIIIPRKIVQQVSFDEIAIPYSASNRSAIIDDFYKTTEGIELQPYDHLSDPNNPDQPVFSPMQGTWGGTDDHPIWYDPHVYAVEDSPWNPSDRFSISPPNTVNIGTDAWGGPTQLFPSSAALKVSFLNGASVVSIDTDYRIHYWDNGKPIYNWQQMFAYDANDNLLDQTEKWGGKGTLTVSDWAGTIAYVMITVNNRWSGVTPYAIFDNLSWTTTVFVVLTCYMLRFGSIAPQARDVIKGNASQLEAFEAIQKKVHNIQREFQKSDKRPFIKPGPKKNIRKAKITNKKSKRS
jgi:hypothetical protein